MTTKTARDVDPDGIVLARGAHEADSGQTCFMEAVAYVAGEPWSDRPACASPVIAAFCRRWNDDLSDADRQMLKPYVPRLVGTNTGAADDGRRAWLVADWFVRTHAAAWLRLSGLDEQADALASLPELVDASSWDSAKPVVEKARQASDAAWAAAWAAARAAATKKLAPTVAELQQSALQLLDRLVAVGRSQINHGGDR